MNKNRDKAWSNLLSADHKLKKGSAENILLFLVLALILVTVRFISIQPSSSEGDILSGVNNIPDVYIWSATTSERNEGLFLFSRHHLAESLPQLLPLIPEIPGRQNSSPVVTAFRYGSDLPRRVDLPPEVANIFFQPIPINRADKNILSSLPGIGPVLAERIVQRREEYGPFMSKDELLRVAGIGPIKYAHLIDHITID